MEIKRKNPSTTRETRRRGSGFDPLAHVFRDVREFLFQNSFSIRNRPGKKIDPARKLITGLVNVKNAAEMFFRDASVDGINSITIGREGDGNSRNTHLIDLEADSRTEIGTKEGYVNGVIRMRVSRNGSDDENRSGVYVMDAATETDGGEGTIFHAVAYGPEGEVRLSYMEDKDDDIRNGTLFDIYISKSGISIYGLPTSAPAGSNHLYNSGGTLKIT